MCHTKHTLLCYISLEILICATQHRQRICNTFIIKKGSFCSANNKYVEKLAGNKCEFPCFAWVWYSTQRTMLRRFFEKCSLGPNIDSNRLADNNTEDFKTISLLYFTLLG
jgi:hypothetical protein